MTLRLRLALVYSLIAFVLIAAVAGFGTWLLTRALDQQFEDRLNDQAAYATGLLTGAVSLGDYRPSGGALLLAVNKDGSEAYRSPALIPLKPGPLIQGGHQQLGRVSVGAVVRPLGSPGVNIGRLWVALPDDSLESAKRSAWQLLAWGLAVAPALMLLVGWAVGRYLLRGLSAAARVAERLDPSAGSIPLPKRHDEVYRLLEAINRLLGRIETQQQNEKRLLGQIVHELGAPLTAIKAYLARASARTGDAEVARAELVAEELSFTAQDLMQLARGQTDFALALHFLPAFQLRDRLDRLVPGVQYLGDWNAMVLCDPDRLVQAIRNVLANARRAAGTGGHVELCLEERAGQVRFVVRDSGPGLPVGLGERIFDPFVSGSGSSGLGLSVSRQIAEQHGGFLSGENRPEGGAEFVLSLPGASALDEDVDEAADVANGRPA